jgi:hypothetical protein
VQAVAGYIPASLLENVAAAGRQADRVRALGAGREADRRGLRDVQELLEPPPGDVLEGEGSRRHGRVERVLVPAHSEQVGDQGGVDRAAGDESVVPRARHRHEAGLGASDQFLDDRVERSWLVRKVLIEGRGRLRPILGRPHRCRVDTSPVIRNQLGGLPERPSKVSHGSI